MRPVENWKPVFLSLTDMTVSIIITTYCTINKLILRIFYALVNKRATLRQRMLRSFTQLKLNMTPGIILAHFSTVPC
jgi:hypothetical protein